MLTELEGLEHSSVRAGPAGRANRTLKDRGGRRLVAIMHQGFIPSYRVRFFELLNRTGDVDYVVIHGPPPSGTGHVAAEGPFAFPNIAVRHRELHLRGRTAIYESLGPLLRHGFDGVVLGTHLLFLSRHVAFAYFKARRRPVLYWGHGHEQAEPRLKCRLARLADGYLAYTNGGASWLAGQGVPADRITVVRNTLDVEGQVELHSRLEAVDEARLRAELGLRPDSTVLLFLGRFYSKKRLGELLEAYGRLRARRTTVELVLVGDGPAMHEIRSETSRLDGVRLTGEIHDQELVARWLRVAAAVVIPGAVGLSVNHALAHATPVITRADAQHGPEIEYLEHDVSGLVVSGGFDAFVAALSAFVDSPQRQRALAAGARVARGSLTLAPMVEAFDRGVRSALDRLGSKGAARGAVA
jgi:glycosyltransferase involved in cell wall biosynthesis